MSHPTVEQAVALIFEGCTTEIEFLRREVAFMRYVLRQERTRVVQDCVDQIRQTAIERRAVEGDEAARRELEHVSASLEEVLSGLA